MLSSGNLSYNFQAISHLLRLIKIHNVSIEWRPEIDKHLLVHAVKTSCIAIISKILKFKKIIRNFRILYAQESRRIEFRIEFTYIMIIIINC